MIIFLYGDDQFRSRQKVAEIKQKYLENDKSGSGLSYFDVENEKEAAKKIMDVFSIPNLLAPKRLVIIKNLITASRETDTSELKGYIIKNLEGISEDKNLVTVFWENSAVSKSDKLSKALEKNSKSQNFEKLTGAKLSQWILKEMKKIDGKSKISKQALEKLVAYAGEDTVSLYQEIQKLVNFSNSEMISERDIEILVKANLDNDIFRTIDMIGANNKKEALALLHRHLENGEDPFYLFSMFVYQFRNLLKIADLKEKRVSSEYAISQTTKMHPFVVRKSLNQVRNFGFIRLKEIYKELGKIDLGVKTGKADMRFSLDKFIAEL